MGVSTRILELAESAPASFELYWPSPHSWTVAPTTSAMCASVSSGRAALSAEVVEAPLALAEACARWRSRSARSSLEVTELVCVVCARSAREQGVCVRGGGGGVGELL